MCAKCGTGNGLGAECGCVVGGLIEPPPRDPVREAIEHCELMVEQGIADRNAIRDGGTARRPSHLGNDYDEAYAQGQKDACRVILLCLTTTIMRPAGYPL